MQSLMWFWRHSSKMRLALALQMRQLDDRAQSEWQLSGDLLMERAALAAAREMKRIVKGKLSKVIICCGKGNNGGDGLALARILQADGSNITAVLLYPREEYRGLAALNLERAEKFGVRVASWSENTASELKDADVIVDAILGTGTFGAPREPLPRVIEAINRANRPVLALDIPSGIDADTGNVPGTAVKAHMTVTFGLAKPGLYIYPGAEYAGEVVIDHIGFPEALIEDEQLFIHCLTVADVQKMLPRREPTAHKGTNGHLLVIGGAPGMYGAPALAALGALRTGSGLVTVAVDDLARFVDKPRETMAVELEDALQRLDDYRAVVVGPGLGAESGLEVMKAVVASANRPLVIDADGLNALAQNMELMKEIRVPAVLTPHPGEMARLTGLETRAIQKDRLNVARSYAEKWQKIVVLKGARTVIALPDGRIYLNLTGNSGMATAGMGDVLAGMIGSLMAQGLPAETAAVLGPYLHGLAGDLAAGQRGPVGIVAGDVISGIPEVYKKVWAYESI